MSATLLLYGKLEEHLGRERVFWDVETLEAGERWPDRIDSVLAQCRVLVAVIGRQWLTAVDNSGQHRLDNPADWVRREITTALRRGIRVIPTLVDDGKLPSEGDLPDDLQSLPSFNAVVVDATRFTYDAERFLAAVDRALVVTSTRQLIKGDIFARHKIEALIGRGGMGVVYRARHVVLKTERALKVLAPELTQDLAFQARFRLEMELAAQLRHPNIVQVFDGDEFDDRLYLAMELIDGVDLAAVMERDGPLAPERAVAIIGQVAEALAYAHVQGLVHRDVKPANILVERRATGEQAYLGDFGLARSTETADTRLTRTGVWVGTADYVAPEQVMGTNADVRSDIYSLGCVLYEALAGHVPFPERSEGAKLVAHARDEAPPLLDSRGDVPPALAEVVARAMRKKPEDRFQTASELADALRAALGTPPSGGARSSARAPGRRGARVEPGSQKTGTGEAPQSSPPPVATDAISSPRRGKPASDATKAKVPNRSAKTRRASKPAARQVTLKGWARDRSEPLMRELIKTFQVSHPDVSVEFSFYDWQAYTNKLRRLTPQSRVPDVIGGDDPTSVLIRQKLISPLDSEYSEFDWNDFVPSAAIRSFRATRDGETRDEGPLWEIHQLAEWRGIFYNKRLLRKYGGDPTHLPETFADFSELLSRLRANAPSKVPVIEFGKDSSGSILDLFHAVQGGFISAELLPRIPKNYGDIDETLHAALRVWGDARDRADFGVMQTLRTWTERGYFNADFEALGEYEAVDEFCDGRGILFIGSTDQAGMINIFCEKTAGFMNMPPGPSGKYVAVGETRIPWRISSKTDHPGTAAKFIDWMLSSSESVQLMQAECEVPLMLREAVSGSGFLMTDVLRSWRQLVADDGLVVSTRSDYKLEDELSKLMSGEQTPEAAFTNLWLPLPPPDWLLSESSADR